MNWKLVTDDAQLQDVLSRAAQCDAVALDTEFMRRNTYYPKVALLQLCFASDADTAWLIDPLQVRDTSGIAQLLRDQNVVKVLHSASEDLEVFQHWLGVLPEPLFDTQRAAALLDVGFGMGYRALVHALTGEDLPKGETRSDWLARPLRDAQCEYAGLDVTWLLRVWQNLGPRAHDQGRYGWVLADGADAVAQARSPVENTHLRIKGGWKLNSRQLAALIAICDWREHTAQTRDKPRGWILDDRACLQLAQSDPRTAEELQQIEEIPASVARRSGEKLLALLAEQRNLPDAACPAPLPQPLAAAQRDSLKKLKSRARKIAAGFAVAPEVLLQSKDYELLVREASGERIVAPAHWSGWRDQAVVQTLRAALAENSG